MSSRSSLNLSQSSAGTAVKMAREPAFVQTATPKTQSHLVAMGHSVGGIIGAFAGLVISVIHIVRKKPL